MCMLMWSGWGCTSDKYYTTMWLQAITLEKKQLFHQWNCSLIGMRRRDEARAAMQEALEYVLLATHYTDMHSLALIH